MIYNMKVCIKLLFILKSVHYIISNGILKHPFVSKFYTVHVFSCIYPWPMIFLWNMIRYMTLCMVTWSLFATMFTLDMSCITVSNTKYDTNLVLYLMLLGIFVRHGLN